MRASDCTGVAPQPFFQGGGAIVAEAGDGHARGGVQGPEHLVRAKDKSPVFLVLAFPVIDSGPDYSGEGNAAPYLLPRRGIQRNDATSLGHHVHDAVHDDGVEEVAARGRIRVIPHDLNLLNVSFGNLFEIHVLGLVSPAAILFPGFMLIEMSKASFPA